MAIDILKIIEFIQNLRVGAQEWNLLAQEMDVRQRALERQRKLEEKWDQPIYREAPQFSGEIYGGPGRLIKEGYRSPVTWEGIEAMGGLRQALPFLSERDVKGLGFEREPEEYASFLERPGGVYGVTRKGQATKILGVPGKPTQEKQRTVSDILASIKAFKNPITGEPIEGYEDEIESLLQELKQLADQPKPSKPGVDIRTMAARTGKMPTGLGRSVAPTPAPVPQIPQKVDTNIPVPKELPGGIGEKDQYGFYLGQTKLKNGKVYKYVGNNQWQGP